MRLVICAGHHIGAKGAENKQYNLNEHDVMKMVALALHGLRADLGDDVHLVSGTLGHKIRQVNELHDAVPVDLALDLHFNADADHLDPNDYDDTRGDGVMVMYMPGSDLRRKQARLMASTLSTRLMERDLGARPGWWWGKVGPDGQPIYPDGFLAKTKCPAFIPEPGYIDNNGAAERLILTGNWFKVAEALSVMCQAYKETYL